MNLRFGTMLPTLAALAALSLTLAPSAHAQTVISGGTYTGMDGVFPTIGVGDGYDASSPTVIIGGTFTGGKGVNFIAGGPGGSGLGVSGGPVTITGGSFAGGEGGDSFSFFVGAGQGGSGLSLSSGSVTVSGGTFVGGAGGRISLAPGSSGPSGYSFSLTGGTLQLQGVFSNVSFPITSGTGSFSGTLAGNSQAATYTYNVTGGSITAAPEPSQFAALGLGVLGLAGLAFRSRRRLSAGSLCPAQPV